MAAISKLYTKILAAFLSLFGFSGTVISCLGGMYGTPEATFKAKGVVVSETDNTPIEGIHVEMDYKNNSSLYEEGSTYTNNSGNFNVSGMAFPEEQILYVKLTDVDGEENGGLFADQMVEANFSNPTFTGKKWWNSWYDGETEIDLGKIKMKPDDKNTP